MVSFVEDYVLICDAIVDLCQRNTDTTKSSVSMKLLKGGMHFAGLFLMNMYC